MFVCFTRELEGVLQADSRLAVSLKFLDLERKEVKNATRSHLVIM